MVPPGLRDGYLYIGDGETCSQGFAGRATPNVAGTALAPSVMGEWRMAAWEGEVTLGGRRKEGEARVMSAEPCGAGFSPSTRLVRAQRGTLPALARALSIAGATYIPVVRVCNICFAQAHRAWKHVHVTVSALMAAGFISLALRLPHRSAPGTSHNLNLNPIHPRSGSGVADAALLCSAQTRPAR